MTKSCDELEIKKKGISEIVAKIFKTLGAASRVLADHSHEVWLWERWVFLSHLPSFEITRLVLANPGLPRLRSYKSPIMFLCSFHSNYLQVLRISAFKHLLFFLPMLGHHYSCQSLSLMLFMAVISVWKYPFHLFTCFLLEEGSMFPHWNVSPYEERLVYFVSET